MTAQGQHGSHADSTDTRPRGAARRAAPAAQPDATRLFDDMTQKRHQSIMPHHKLRQKDGKFAILSGVSSPLAAVHGPTVAQLRRRSRRQSDLPARDCGRDHCHRPSWEWRGGGAVSCRSSVGSAPIVRSWLVTSRRSLSVSRNCSLHWRTATITTNSPPLDYKDPSHIATQSERAAEFPFSISGRPLCSASLLVLSSLPLPALLLSLVSLCVVLCGCSSQPSRQCPKRLRGRLVNQRPPPPLVHEPRPRGSRRCTKLELSVVLVHESSRNSITESPVVVHEKKHGGAARSAAPSAVRFGVQLGRPVKMGEIGPLLFK